MAGSPGMAGDHQGQRHRMAEGLDVSTGQKQWRCSDVVRACREEGTKKKKIINKKNNRRKKKKE